MIDFNAILGAAIEQGMDMEDIVSQFTAAANKIEEDKKKQEQEAKREAAKARDEVLKKLEDSFWASAKRECLTGSDLCALATLITAYDDPIGRNFNAKELKDYYSYVSDIFENMPKTFIERTGETSASVSNNSKEVEKKEENCGTDRRACDCDKLLKDVIDALGLKPIAEFKKEDAEKISEFLNMFHL